MPHGVRLGYRPSVPLADDTDPQLYARSFADVYDAWYGDLDDPATIVAAFAARLAPAATIVELGSGTGRLAGPLAQAGFNVLALDASPTMLAQDRSSLSRIAADMASPPLRQGSAAGVLIAYNTFFNLPGREAQQACLDEASRVLAAGGMLAIDVFTAPQDRRGEFGMTVREHPTRANARLALLTGPDEVDDAVIVGSHIEIGDTTTCRPWRVAYCSPRDLDALAHAAGLSLAERGADWHGSPFEADSLRQVTWYRR